ncbi:glutathione peroxidase [Shewanella surugensis]|uniref:Glutathione peroxidase n=1 Tax=Shewanella surugensis TaxID=212020 RepID=A0ABT0LEG8_9GAMM|nr:glutathione peroxidase [Shewanella surugensis]MCL1126050.1 glutathione peroxidase [Shewanella surugensis]
MADSIYQFSAIDIQGTNVSLKQYENKVVLIVNTASKCGFTPQYKALEALYKKYQSQGLVILGFPCNQFGQQEQGSNDEISAFCELNFGVTFPLFQKIDVNGSQAHPLYQYLKTSAKGVFGSEKVKWNFTKFIIDKTGQVTARFAPTTKPEALEDKIIALL